MKKECGILIKDGHAEEVKSKEESEEITTFEGMKEKYQGKFCKYMNEVCEIVGYDEYE